MLESEKALLTRWPSATTISVASVKSMALNYRVLEHMAELWTETFPYPKVFPVEYLRREVGQTSSDSESTVVSWNPFRGLSEFRLVHR